MDKTPHFSRIKETPETLNPVTGRSIYYGMRPWRCDDRFQDWLKAFTCLDGVTVQYNLLKRFFRCARSDEGQEPIDNYHRLGRGEVMYYVERYQSRMMRTGVLETYPYDQNELRRIAEEDGLKMRVWRHQRELELESKEGKIDEVIHMNVMKRNKPST
ncbi:putative mitochondrial hypothetical protein [Leptomonas pyrrhocoris]|uniref:Uncharacterized protein n=1 Tax=Leptomonas pyrrhocoris TaxID=157538 RepID=A0A0M9G0R3_LEPPY|nr:putative mitochondrial hypothetical protein [Leptomonas pyrrhocoris]XP_015658269.1 putative mitochondrial hypothetical protein [Leptomonas pyrrhocoris]KPA79829.1 putative mitochondrial hypothetical protein [Leptomonas pyrrhocoris]KPA79830.1 putative mitochondrial hypothetical protein [Leptomonas pyrrhocoris]|eukprot:XP_015658268.1 putative mitochondrial hypothetical protein [Leptomonas pyrrhocoris]